MSDQFTFDPSQKIDWKKPTFTMDVNAIPIKPVESWPQYIASLEWNYFYTHQIELCVTPETSGEILRGVSLEDAGASAFKRFQKSESYKKRPLPGIVTLETSNSAWKMIRRTLFDSVADSALSAKHLSDINQVFFHLVTSGHLTNSALVTNDGDMLRKSAELKSEFGITIATPKEVWGKYSYDYQLYTPSPQEEESLFREQDRLFAQLEKESKEGI